MSTLHKLAQTFLDQAKKELHSASLKPTLSIVQRSATAEGGAVIMAIENSSMTFKATITVGVSEQIGYWDTNLVKHCWWFTLKKTRDSSLRRK